MAEGAHAQQGAGTDRSRETPAFTRSQETLASGPSGQTHASDWSRETPASGEHPPFGQHPRFGLQAGAQIPELKITPDKYLPVRYAGASGDFNPIHLDDEFARSVGLPGRILHGLWTMAQVARAQTEAAGGPHALKRLSVTVRGTGVPEHELTVTGTVESVANGVAVVSAVVEQDGRAIVRRAEAELQVE